MLKEADSIYPIKFKGENRTPEWSKFKNVKDIDVIVFSSIEKREKETGRGLKNWMYWAAFEIPCRLAEKFPKLEVKTNKWGEEVPNVGGVWRWKGKCYSIIGRSYATKERVRRGEIITVRTVRIRKFGKNGKIWYTWMFPVYGGKRPEKKEADTLTTVQRIERVGSAPLSKEAMKVLKTETELTEEELLALTEKEFKLNLELCPFWEQILVCPVRHNFDVSRWQPREEDYRDAIRLKLPLSCSLGEIFRCPFVKRYYYEEEKSLSNVSIEEIEVEENEQHNL